MPKLLVDYEIQLVLIICIIHEEAHSISFFFFFLEI